MGLIYSSFLFIFYIMFFLTKLYKCCYLNNDIPSFSLLFNNKNDISSNMIKSIGQHNLTLIDSQHNIYCLKKYIHDIRLTQTNGTWYNPYIIEFALYNLEYVYIPSLQKSYFFYILRLLSTDINMNTLNIQDPYNDILISLFGSPIKSKIYYNESIEDNYIYAITHHEITNDQLKDIKKLNKYPNTCNNLNLNIFRFRFKKNNISQEYYAIEIKKSNTTNIQFVLIDFSFYNIFKNEIEIDYYSIHKKYSSNNKIIEMYDEDIYKYKEYSDDTVNALIPPLEDFINMPDNIKTRYVVKLFTNPNIFTYDYERIKKLNKNIKYELTVELYKPWRIEKFLKTNNDIDMYLHY